MENISYGISPEDEMPEIMKDIEKNIREQENETPDEGDNSENFDIEQTPEEDVASEEDDVSEEAEPISESDIFKEKYQIEKRKRKSVLADRQRLEQENQYLKTHLTGTVEHNAELYGRDLYNDLEKIRNIKKQALLGDDPDLLVEADEVYQRTLYKVNEYENYLQNKENSNSDADVDQSDNTDYEDQIKLTSAQEWLEDHPELVEDSYKYDPNLQKDVGMFIERFDKALIQNGRGDEILNDSYLEVLDEYISQAKKNETSDGYSTSQVGGVRNNFSGGSSGQMKITLTAFDKNYAKNLGISEKEYLKYKIEDIKESKKQR